MLCVISNGVFLHFKQTKSSMYERP